MNIERRREFLISTLYFAVVSVLLYFVYKYLPIYMLPFLIGLLLAHLLQKPSEFLAKKIKIKSGTIAAILAVVCYIAVMALLVLLVFLVVSNTDKILNFVQYAFTQISNIFSGINGRYSDIIDRLPQNVASAFSQFPEQLLNRTASALTTAISGMAANTVKSLPGVFFSIIITVVAGCYIAKDYRVVREFILSFIPERHKKTVFAAKKILFTNVFKLLKGYGILMLVTFAVLAVGLLVLGQKNAVIIAFVIAAIDILPIIGAGAVLIPWSIILMLNGSFYLGVGIAVIYVLLVVLRNFLEPKIISVQIGIPPLVILIMLFFGLKLFGFIGMILSIITLMVTVNLYKQGLIEL